MKNICGQFFGGFWKHVLDQNGSFINMFQTNIRNVSLSVILEFCLSVVVCVLAPAYTSLCRGLKYLPKVRYIILVDPLWARFLIFETVFLGRSATLPYVWKIISQKWAAFAFGSTYLHQTFTECMFNQYTHFDTSTCQMWLQVVECHLILLHFLGIFIHYCLNYCISTKLSLIICLINTHILVY